MLRIAQATTRRCLGACLVRWNSSVGPVEPPQTASGGLAPAFVDPANARMDLSGPNPEIYNRIVAELKERRRKRITLADAAWREQYQRQVRLRAAERKPLKHGFVAGAIATALREATISPQTAGAALGVGDVVALADDSTAFYLVVGVPASLDAPHYTFVNKEGEVVFGRRDCVRLRFPRAIPADLDVFLRTLVLAETKWRNVAPVGYPDANFTRLEAAWPQEDQAGGATKGTQGGGDGGSATYKAAAAGSATVGANDAAASGTAAVGASDAAASAASSGAPGAAADDDLIISSAALQLLTNTNVVTYQVTWYARSLYSAPLRDLAIRTAAGVQSVKRRLEALHRLLQFDPDGEPLDSPRTVSIFELMQYLRHVELSDVELVERTVGGETHAVRDRARELCRLAGVDGSAMQGPRIDAYPIATYLAVVLALRHQSRLWNLNQQTPSNPPLSVTVLPVANVAAMRRVVLALKLGQLTTQFAQCVVATGAERPPLYRDLVKLIKDYIAGNFGCDPEAETAVVLVIRKVEELLPQGRPMGAGPPPTFEYSKMRAYEILHHLGECAGGWENPAAWLYALQLPGRGVLHAADADERYFEYLDAAAPEPAEDPLRSVRRDFAAPVYCIDAETAHEIDDGVLIEAADGVYTVTVHVANPTSYISPTLPLARIAFDRGTTTYMPEGATMMLPQFMARMAGLGVDGRRTRTFYVQFEVSRTAVEQYLATRDAALLSGIRKTMASSASVGFGTVSNFPQGYTYTRVNEVLNSKANALAYKLGAALDADATNLFRLHDVATVLRDIRVTVGGALSIAGRNSSIRVGASEPPGALELTLPNGPTIAIGTTDQGLQSKSQLLVSECMVGANALASSFAKRHGIALIHRTQDMNLDALIAQEIRDLMPQGQELDPESMHKLLPFLTSARLETQASTHQSLGVEGYATVTSPLRRFVDMVHHWKFADFLLGSKLFSNLQLAYIGCHLQSRELVNKQGQRFAINFWAGLFLKHHCLNVEQGKAEPIELKLLVQSKPKGGLARVQLVNVAGISADLMVTTELLQRLGADLSIGTTIEGVFDFEKLDYIEHEILLKLAQ